MSLKSYFNTTISRDLLRTIAGKKLGEGAFRKVYRFLPDPNYVIKFETRSRDFQNVIEWQLWQQAEGRRFEKWFAPCKTISPCGTILVQRFARDLAPQELPKRVPAFFGDVQEANWGFYKGRPVCRDYGLLVAPFSKAMKKTDFSR